MIVVWFGFSDGVLALQFKECATMNDGSIYFLLGIRLIENSVGSTGLMIFQTKL
jgi:hypothetical protein